MRLLRALLALYHSSRALRLQRLANAHGAKAEALLGRTSFVRKEVHEVALHPVERILLASIVGLGIAGLWIMICARASL